MLLTDSDFFSSCSAYRDNLNTDIFGANLYHRYLTRHRSGRSLAGIAAVVTGRGAIKASELEIETEENVYTAEECLSILVQVSEPFLTYNYNRI